MFLIYSIYSLVTNIAVDLSEITVSELLLISLGSKQLYGTQEKITQYVIGAWIGVAMLILWAVSFLGLKYFQKEEEVHILMETKSVSEFSLVIENIPTGLSKA